MGVEKEYVGRYRRSARDEVGYRRHGCHCIIHSICIESETVRKTFIFLVLIYQRSDLKASW